MKKPIIFDLDETLVDSEESIVWSFIKAGKAVGVDVEGMSMEALEQGIDWRFETFPEYLSVLEHLPKRLNVGALVGHSTLRLFVLGGEERPATAKEVEAMCTVLREAMAQGAMG
ncbi:MAG: hypothetical protein QXD75_05505, partial [Desulfurococcaceae archaeon]